MGTEDGGEGGGGTTTQLFTDGKLQVSSEDDDGEGKKPIIIKLRCGL